MANTAGQGKQPVATPTEQAETQDEGRNATPSERL